MFSHIQEHHGTFKWSSPPLSFTNSFSLSICQAGKVLSPIFCMPGKFPGNRSFVTLKLLGDFRDLYLGFLKSKDSFPFLKGQMSVGSHRQHLLSRRILARSVALRLRTYRSPSQKANKCCSFLYSRTVRRNPGRQILK